MTLMHQEYPVCELQLRIVHIGEGFLNLSSNQDHLKDLLPHNLLDLTPRVSDSVVLGTDLRICISNKFPGDADASSSMRCLV